MVMVHILAGVIFAYGDLEAVLVSTSGQTNSLQFGVQYFLYFFDNQMKLGSDFQCRSMS